MTESLHILILEDNPADAELIEFELREAGLVFTSKVVMTERDFIRELYEFSPDVILSDYDLPRYTGAAALAQARRSCPATPFILVTGAVTEDRAIEILTQGAKDYVLKTRLQQRLAPAVRRALAEARERRARMEAESELRQAYRSLEKQVEERTFELQESKERLSLALTSSGMGIFEWDIATDRRFFDERVHRLLGIRPDHFSGTSEEFFQAIHPDDRLTVRNALRTAIEKNIPYEAEYRVVWPDTSVHHIAVRGKVQRDNAGRPLRIVGVCWGITRRKQAEEALRQSEERLRLLHDTMRQGVIYQDASGVPISANPAALRILGITPDMLVGATSVTRQRHCIREDGTPFPADEHPSLVALRTGREVRDVMMGIYNPAEDQLRWVHIDSVPLFREGEGKPYQVYTIFSDMTERRQAEEALRKSGGKEH